MHKHTHVHKDTKEQRCWGYIVYYIAVHATLVTHRGCFSLNHRHKRIAPFCYFFLSKVNNKTKGLRCTKTKIPLHLICWQNVEQTPAETVVYGNCINFIKQMWWFIEVSGHAAGSAAEREKWHHSYEEVNEKMKHKLSLINWRSYQWCPLYLCKVLQQALSVVDGGVELRIGILPLTIQIFSTQGTTMTTAERRWQKRGRWQSGRKQSNRVLQDKIVCVFLYKAVMSHRPRFSRCVCVNLQVFLKSVIISPHLFLLTFHLQLHQGWAWGLSWRCRLPSDWLPVGWCPSGTPACPSLPSWH